MNYFQMTTQQLEQEHSALQGKVRNASPSDSEYREELTKLSRVQALLSNRYAQSVKAHLSRAERTMWVQ
jgi:hypothetical protein